MKINNETGALTFLVVKKNFDVFFIKDAEVKPFSDISLDDLNMLRRHMEYEPGAMRCLENAGIDDPLEQIKKWVSCNFSTITSQPDFLNGRRLNYSRPRCIFREEQNCPLQYELCNKGGLTSPNFKLTKRQVEILISILSDLPEVEMADNLCISLDTLRNHKYSLRQKLNIRSSAGLALFAHEFCN